MSTLLKTDLERGIDDEIRQRKQAFGSNTYPSQKGHTFWVYAANNNNKNVLGFIWQKAFLFEIITSFQLFVVVAAAEIYLES